MDVRPMTVEEAVTLAFEPDEFPARFGARLVPGWSEPGTLEPTVFALEAGIDPGWLTYLLVAAAPDGTAEVVGMGGFTGPPRDGEVEIGYRVAPSRRGRGVATTAVRTWVDRARAAGLVRVLARTVPGPHASATVLARCGFCPEAPREGDREWRWALALGR